MARPYWSGQIQISLVSFGVKLFVATEARSDIHFHQIDRKTGERVRHQQVLASAIENDPDEAADPIDRNRIVKGYEYSKGQYITLEPEELAHLRVPSKHTMEIAQFVEETEISPEFFEKPYFVVPEDDTQTEAFATVRKALLDTKKAALSRIAFGGREHIVAIVSAGPDAHGGMMAYTLRYAAELRDPAEYFRDIKKTAVESDSLALAKELIQRKSGQFDPSKFIDGYEAAVKELVEAKLKHSPIPKDEAPKPTRGKVINLMDALRKSIHSGGRSNNEETRPATPEKKRGLSLVKSSGKKATRPETKSAKTTHKRKSA